jgi:hypothetical protein
VYEQRVEPPQILCLAKYAQSSGLRISLAPHDLRRTYAHLAFAGNAPLEQIQFSLGHASIVTTERYLGTRQNLRRGPCDYIQLLPVAPVASCLGLCRPLAWSNLRQPAENKAHSNSMTSL